MTILFNKPPIIGKEASYINEVIASGKLTEGVFNKKCEQWFTDNLTSKKALLVPSCTAALEMSIILAGIERGDEVIMPSYTFTSTATAVVMRGGVPVFIDIDPDTLNLDDKLIEQAITEKTKAIIPVHYAGAGCAMDKIMDIAKKHDLVVIEDAAQGICASYKDKPLGSLGHMTGFSFHETKNIVCGEGGALIINDERFIEKVEILRDKGTNRAEFFRGEIDKYSWKDLGSSYLMSELQAAFLYAQLEHAEEITTNRIETWQLYHNSLEGLEEEGLLKRPVVFDSNKHNAHIYYVMLPNESEREGLQRSLKEKGIHAVPHYVPLHNSPGGKKFGRVASEMGVTGRVSGCLLRLPLYYGLTQADVESVVKAINDYFGK